MIEDTDRRSFYVACIYGIWGLIGLALGVPAMVYLLLPPKIKREEEWVEAAAVEKLEPGVPEEVIFRRNRADGWKISSEKTSAWVVRGNGDDVVAFAPQCTHLGCAYHWDQRKKEFLCPCHTSTFSLEGKVTSGPAPRPLDRYQARIEDGKLMLGPIVQSKES